MTQAADQLENVLGPRFPGIRFGRYNCRRIAGSERYSQHSWSNARDIYAPLEHEDPSAFIDDVVEWCEANEDALSVRLILWQVRDHFGHAHIDFWPTGYAVPPCDMGVSQFQYSDGHKVFVRDPMPENGYFIEEEEPMFPYQGDQDSRNARQFYIEQWQIRLAELEGFHYVDGTTNTVISKAGMVRGLYDNAMGTLVAKHTDQDGRGIGPREATQLGGLG